MYKCIIIDDDEFSLGMLSEFVDWQKMGFSLAEAFSDSENAFSYLQKNEVSLVLSDIKMPGKDGIAIAELCSSLNPPPVVVFISAYSEFEYAQKALKYNVIDYITKPFSISQIEEILQKAKQQLDASVPKKQISSSLALKQQLFFCDLLSGGIKNISALSEQMEAVEINSKYINNKAYILNINLINLKYYLTNVWKHGKERFFSAFYYFVSSTEQYFSCVVSISDENAKAILLPDNSGTISISKYISDFKNNLSEILNLECEMTVEKEYAAFSDTINDNIITNNKNAVEQAIVFIKNNFSSDISLESVANHVFLNKVYFSSLFKSTTGDNFTTYLNKIRIEKALELLKKSDMTVASIATEVGYQSLPYFYKIFNDHTGYTPVKYKEILNEKQNS